MHLVEKSNISCGCDVICREAGHVNWGVCIPHAGVPIQAGTDLRWCVWLLGKVVGCRADGCLPAEG